MKKIVLACTTIVLALNFAPAAFADLPVKDKCAVTHGEFGYSTLDSCHLRQRVRIHIKRLPPPPPPVVIYLQSPHSPSPSSGSKR